MMVRGWDWATATPSPRTVSDARQEGMSNRALSNWFHRTNEDAKKSHLIVQTVPCVVTAPCAHRLVNKECDACSWQYADDIGRNSLVESKKTLRSIVGK